MGKIEERIRKIKKLTETPEKIRNIGVVAHIDHGKCVAGDSRISLWSGENWRADDLFHRYEKEGKLEVDEKKEKRIEVRNLKLRVNSFDKGRGKIEKGEITHLWKLKKTKPLVEVRLHNGSTIKSTPEHRFLILSEEGKFVERRADKIKIKDNIVSARKLRYKPLTLTQLKAHFLQELAEDLNFYVSLNQKMKEELHKKVLGYGRKKVWKKIKSPLKWLSFYHGAWRGQYRLRDLVRVVKFFHFQLDEVYDQVRWINYRGLKQRGVHSSVALKLPKGREDFENFYYLLGCFFGDGSFKVIDNKDPEIHSKIKEIAKKTLGVKAKVKTYEKKCPRIYLNAGVTLMKILERAFSYPSKQKSKNIKISSLVERVHPEFISKFIQGYFDTDGTIERKRSAVSLTSSSLEMLKSLQLLLYKFDIASNLNFKKNSLYISGQSSLSRFKKIGFTLKDKRERLRKLVKKSSSSKLDRIPIKTDSLAKIRKKLNLSQSQIFTGYSNYEGGRIGLTRYSLGKIRDRFQELASGSEMEWTEKLISEDIQFSEVKEIRRSEKEKWVYDFTVEPFHNFIAEGVIVHNTTLSDNLLYHAGMISKEMAGKQLALDFREDERARGITINAANVSMVHEFEGDEYLINMIDTPGHVDFGGDVTRAMRAVDGVILVVCAVEGVMPQTKTNLLQALRERVKPTLFINKVDRLINELKLSPEELQNRFLKIISEVNNIIKERRPEGVDWEVSVDKGSVTFGSAFHNWAISVPFMKKTGITFNDIIKACNEERQKELADKAPAYEIVLNMVIRHLESPLDVQKIRIPQIWKGGDLESEVGKAMLSCDPQGPLAGMITNISVFDKREGEVATARLFSGTVKEGQEAYLCSSKSKERVQQVSFYSGASRIKTEEIPAGNIVGITGLKKAFAGETLSTSEIEEFEGIQYVSEPVVTMAIEAKSTKDLPRVIEVLRQVAKEDPSLQVEIDQETGEHLLSGMGELHLEVITNRIKGGGLNINVSEPIVVYRETISGSYEAIEGKSPNKHNKFYLAVEPLEEKVYQAITKGKIKEGRRKKRSKDIRGELVELGMDNNEAKRIVDIYRGNILIDMTRGIVQLEEVIELILDAFEQVMSSGPLANEPCTKVKVKLMDTKLHEDAIHRGPAQVYPAVRNPIYAGMLLSQPTLLEPIQKVWVDVPQKYMSPVTQELQRRRGMVGKMEQKENLVQLKGKMPVAESFGFAGDIRSASEGHALWSTENAGFEPVPSDLQMKVIQEVRDRKGLSKGLPKAQDFIEK